MSTRHTRALDSRYLIALQLEMEGVVLGAGDTLVPGLGGDAEPPCVS
jgi:hypothetical protein